MGAGLAVTLLAQRTGSGDRSARRWVDGLAPSSTSGFGDSGLLIRPVMGSLVRPEPAPGRWWECPPSTRATLLLVNWNKCTREGENCQGEFGWGTGLFGFPEKREKEAISC
ncbi:hypothetical protein Krac_7094 [Ktedonobacter racemifer DSM 44963]|uniref:Uncharacterized protein n=1 Tax=Ktedonobacter racemifer DSM 44963 TaxID=485913 RepID=D6TQX4_KTERA|nr:hypothetical protein Krac_7094 [Ktedonobacter racemifer DSM 44963]